MANYDEIGENGLDQLLAKRLITPGGAVSPTVAPELFPGLTLENDRPEWGWLKGELMYGRGLGITAPVASGYIMLRNPAGSGILAVVQRIVAAASTGQMDIQVVPLGNLPAGSSQGACPPRDARQSLIAGGIHVRLSQLLAVTGDAALVTFAQVARSMSTTLDYSEPIVLVPGTELGIVARTATATMTAYFAWTERKANPGEL